MPGPDEFTARLAAAGQAVGTKNPQLAATLAGSDLSNTEIQAVGGFAGALSLATTMGLARDSGAQPNLTNAQNTQLSAIGVTPPQPEQDSRSGLQRALDAFGSFWSNTGNFVIHNPVMQAALWAGDQLGNAAHYPFRLLSSALDSNNDAEVNKEMTADGYNPDSTTSYLAFMWNQGENVYHDLSAARARYGDKMVDAVVQMQRDPQQFQNDFQSNADKGAAMKAMMQTPDWAEAVAAVDQRHISPGRDVARIVLGGHTNNWAFQRLSGVLDGAYDWFSDPTLILGKTMTAVRALDALGRDYRMVADEAGNMVRQDYGRIDRGLQSVASAVPFIGNRRAGLSDMVDQAGVQQLLRVDPKTGQPVTRVGKAWQRFLDDNADLRAAHEREAVAKAKGDHAAADQAAAERAGIYRAMQVRYGQSLMPLSDEVNGQRIIAEGEASQGASNIATNAQDGGHVTLRTGEAPITQLSDLADYLTSKNGFLRLTNGMAAKQEIVMPGRLSMWAERKAAADTVVAKRTQAKALWLDYTKTNVQPDASEAELLAGAGDLGDQQLGMIQKSMLGNLQAVRAKADRLSRRITTLIPNATKVDLTGSSSSKLVENFARIYMNKGDAARMASAYALGTIADRRNIVKGMIEQTVHASGLTKSPEGMAYLEKLRGEIDGERQMYAFDGNDLINDNGTQRAVGIYPDQQATSVTIPDLRKLHYMANKYAVGAYARKSGIAGVQHFAEGNFADKLMATIKLGWITTPAGGLRNAVDEMANFAINRIGRQALAGRVAYTRGNAALREERVRVSQQMREDMASEGLSKAAMDERIREKLGAATVGYDQAKRDLEAAHRGKLALDNAENQHAATTQRLQDRLDAAQQAHDQVKMQVKAVTDSGDTEALRPLVEDQLPAAKQAHQQAAAALRAQQRLTPPAPGEQTAAAQAKLDAAGVLTVPDAERALTQAGDHFRQTKLLENAIAYRVPLAFRRAADNLNDLLSGVVLGKIMSVTGHKVTDDMVKYAQELTEHELTQILREGVMQAHYNDSGMFLGSDEYAMGLHQAGLRARKYSYQGKFLGYGQVETDGGSGLDAMAKTLQLRFANSSSPAHAWVQTVQRMTQPAGVHVPVALPSTVTDKAGLDAALAAEVKAGRPVWYDAKLDGNLRRLNTPTQFDRLNKAAVKLKQNVGDPARWRVAGQSTGVIDPTALQSAQAAVRAELDKPELRHFIDQAEVFRQTNAGDKVTKETPGLLETAKDQYAERVSADLLHALARKGDGGPVIHQGLLDMLASAKETGMVPDRSWLAMNVPVAERPPTAIGQLWAPYNGTYEPDEIPRGMTQMMGKAYTKVVSDQIAALSRNPLVSALYVNARRNTIPYRNKLIEAGWDEPSADAVVKRVALTHAQDEALKHIDNPYVSSQFSLLSRNWFSFIRAQEDWVRRWGRTLRDNPQLIREAQLLIHGGESTGFVQQDDRGQLEFVYPGSRMMMDLFTKAFAVTGDSPVRVPVVGELTSQLMLLNPSLDNPIGLTGTPLLSMPVKALTKLTGADGTLVGSSIDTIVNGQMGANRNWYEMILPSWANRIMGGVFGSGDNGASKYAAAVAQSMVQLEAAGHTSDPALQTPAGKAAYMQALGAQTRNNLAFTALFGLFAPAAPSLAPGGEGGLPSDPGKPGTGNRPDWSAHAEGLRTLQDEARAMVSQYGYSKALEWWAKVHPGEMIYLTGGARTKVDTPKASTPASIRAATWMEATPEFRAQYGGENGVASYFMPQGTPGTKDAQYSDVAYRAELEAGVRSYKPLSELFDDIVTARGEKTYFDAKDAYDAAKLSAVKRGANSAVKKLDAQWALDKADIYTANPLLQQKFAAYAVDNAITTQSIEQVTRMAGDTSPSTLAALGPNRPGLLALLDAYTSYQAGIAKLAGARSNQATKQTELLKATYAAAVQQIASGPTAQYPELADLARGVFRTP